MNYILINEQLAIDLGIISENHFYRKGDGKVIFKSDILTIWEQNNNQKLEENQYEIVDTNNALKQIEKWTQ